MSYDRYLYAHIDLIYVFQHEIQLTKKMIGKVEPYYA